MRIDSIVRKMDKSSAFYTSRLHYYYNEAEIQLFTSKEITKKALFSRFTKRVFDLVLSFALLPIILPLIFLIAIIIRIDSYGSPLFTHNRMGKDFKDFNCYKFRTMYVNSEHLFQEHLNNNKEAMEEWKNYKKLKRFDPRITRIGGFLRKTSLDELPQIFNVIKGEMSLIGPRPYLPREELDMRPYSKNILSVVPGITGLWQVSGRNKLTFKERLKLDSWYAVNRTLWLDLIILIKTVKVVFLRDGAY